MTRFPRPASRVLILLVAAFGAGCAKTGGDSPLSSNDTLLRYVPADSPYVIAAIEPLPDAIADIQARQFETILDVLRRGLLTAIEDIRGGQAQGPEAEALGLLNELISPATIDSLGFSRDSTMVLYGFGLLPVLRVTLSEGHDFEGFLARLDALFETDGSDLLQTASVAGQEYRYLAADPARIIAALFENELVLTVVPATFGDNQLASILGVELPGQSIADSGRLAAIAAEYGYTAQMISLLDLERIVDTFLGQPNATDQALFDLVGYDAQAVSAACRNDVRDLAGVMPAIVGGYTELNANILAMSAVVELREDIAEGLARIPVPVQGLGAATDALMSFGMSVNIPAAREFAMARLDAIEADPFECEAFANMPFVLSQARASLNEPLPPMVDGIKGFSLMLDADNIDFANMTTLPEDIELSALIATDDAAGLLAMASLFDPQFAALDLGTDGEIVEIELPAGIAGPGPNPFGSLFVAATESEIGVGVGRGGEASLGQLMNAPPGDPSTFFSMSLDMGRYYALMADSMQSQLPVGTDPAALVFISSMSEVMRGLQDVYDREYIDVRFTGRGIEIPVRVELAD